MAFAHLLPKLFLLLFAAWGLGRLALRLGFPMLLGEILAGVLLGPPIFGVVSHSESLRFLSELGAFFILFYAGLEIEPRELEKYFFRALPIALGGFFLPFGLGLGLGLLMGIPYLQALVLGLLLSVSAIAINLLILKKFELHRLAFGHLILAATLFVELLAILSFTAVFEIYQKKLFEYGALFWSGFKIVLFFASTVLVGRFLVPPLARRFIKNEDRAFTFSLLAALGLAYLAEELGIHITLGAFLAGQFVSEEIFDPEVFEKLKQRYFGLTFGFLSPVFFASLGFQLQMTFSLEFLELALLFLAIGLLGKVIGSGFFQWLRTRNLWESIACGLALNGRGSVDLVLASAAFETGLLSPDLFGALLSAIYASVLVTPILLRWALKRVCAGGHSPHLCPESKPPLT
ncbi:cation:proton antiporter [Thermosulfurimonas dismutans]|uniref:Cation/H+ exchanger transmembrane domain-containing protein n=1 Tax=Thermosulfurimonas dismutans TaxID=999894 RepID=A0A179D6S3_9BACT|nr:cation:proton antiporter [Thermosulfurimonas dismutans]OAQ21790.1 hypothetical protein TDIS_0308 [Thermosulfurimonas dismutans]